MNSTMRQSVLDFVVEKLPDGGLLSRAVSADMFTEANYLVDLHANVLDAVRYLFHDAKGVGAPIHVKLIFLSDRPVKTRKP